MSVIPFPKVTVTTSSTIVRLTTGQTDTNARVALQSITIQTAPGNTGVVYVGNSTLVVSSGTGVIAAIPAPTSATTGPFGSVTLSIPLAPAGLNLADYYVDSTHSGDIVYVSGSVQ